MLPTDDQCRVRVAMDKGWPDPLAYVYKNILDAATQQSWGPYFFAYEAQQMALGQEWAAFLGIPWNEYPGTP